MRWQSSENHDDITALQYHPSDNHMLLSGGDDGLVGVFDTTIQDDNESLIQAFNHGAFGIKVLRTFEVVLYVQKLTEGFQGQSIRLASCPTQPSMLLVPTSNSQYTRSVTPVPMMRMLFKQYYLVMFGRQLSVIT